MILPCGLKLLQTRFDLARSVQRTPLRGGGGLAIDHAPARWSAAFATPAELRRAEIDPVVALVDSLRGGLVRVEVSDWLRKYPRAHGAAVLDLARFGGGAFDGSASVTALTAHTAALSGLPVGLTLSPGDMIGLVAGTVRTLHRIGAAATASAAGTATVTVEPMIPTAALADPVSAALVAPTCLMILAEDPETSRDLGREGVSFKLVQVPF